VLDILTREYEVERTVVEQDLLDLCRQLCANGLGEVVPLSSAERAL
jgi:hypothetical protein